MPRPYWTGQLRLSLVSCPIYLTPATSERERIRLHQINPATGNRIALQPVDTVTRDPVERSDLVRGYEIEKGHYVILTNEELDDLKIESSRLLDLTTFVDRASIDPIYIDASYYVYPEKGGEEAYRVIAEAMEKQRKVALGRVTFAMREHPVLVEPFDGGILMATLRSADAITNIHLSQFHSNRLVQKNTDDVSTRGRCRNLGISRFFAVSIFQRRTATIGGHACENASPQRLTTLQAPISLSMYRLKNTRVICDPGAAHVEYTR